MSKNIIWTTEYCSHCDKAKDLMDKNGDTYEVRLVDGFISISFACSFILRIHAFPP